MTRAQRIALAMYGHQKPAPTVASPFGIAPQSRASMPWIFAVVDAMAERWDPITADLPRSPIIGGNLGLPCA